MLKIVASPAIDLMFPHHHLVPSEVDFPAFGDEKPSFFFY